MLNAHAGALLLVFVLLAGRPTSAPAQDAARPAVGVAAAPDEQPSAPSATPALPELSALDQAFKEQSLGKEADERRTRIEIRNLQNEISRNPEVMAAKAAADSASTDLEKRNRLRSYYNLSYGLMSRRASSSAVKAALEQSRKEKIALVAQPRVRPETGEAPAPTPKPRKHKRTQKRF